MVDMAHIAGLVAAGLHDEPDSLCPCHDHHDPQDSTRAPRRHDPIQEEVHEKFNFNKAVFPGIQGGPLMHVIAAKAVCFKEALDPSFKDVSGADCEKCKGSGRKPDGTADFGLVSGGTDNHLMLVDLRNMGVTGKAAERLLDAGKYYLQQEYDPE